MGSQPPVAEPLEWTGATRRKRDAKRFNEHVKLFATFLNNFAIALVVTGVLAPAMNGAATFNWPRALLVLSAAFVLHGCAQAILRLWRSEE